MALLLVFSLPVMLFESPIFWLFSLIKRFTPVTSQLRTTFQTAQKNFSQDLFRKNLMRHLKSSTLFKPASPGISRVWARTVLAIEARYGLEQLGRGLRQKDTKKRRQSDKKMSLAF
ncbi:hypothetical protein ACAW63_25285 [Pseudomonas sp. QE6]|uniref:hypothetical protein n=1 Tax=Pseudomonas sp. QE6 TaxID=3242491 RepID=UPI003526EFA2